MERKKLIFRAVFVPETDDAQTSYQAPPSWQGTSTRTWLKSRKYIICFWSTDQDPTHSLGEGLFWLSRCSSCSPRQSWIQFKIDTEFLNYFKFYLELHKPLRSSNYIQNPPITYKFEFSKLIRFRGVPHLFPSLWRAIPIFYWKYRLFKYA